MDVASLVGTVVDEVSIEVERGKISEFARASFAFDPAHVDPDFAKRRGYGDVLATATHSVVVGHRRDQAGFVEALGLDIRRVVVGAVSWRYERPLVAGDALTARRVVTKDEWVETKRGDRMRRIAMETTFVDSSSHVVMVQGETLLERPRL